MGNDDVIKKEEEITLKDFFLKIKELSIEVWRNWKLVIAILLGTLLLVQIINYFTAQTYSAKLTFLVDEDDSGDKGLSSILGLIGVGGATSVNSQKVLDLAKSRYIVADALFREGVVNGKKDILANHLLDVDNLRYRWKRTVPFIKKVHFNVHSLDSLSMMDRKIFLMEFDYIVGNPDLGIDGIMKTGVTETSDIMNVQVTTRSEELSILLSKFIFENLSAYYIRKSMAKEKMTYDLIKSKRDSIERILTNADYKNANFTDTHYGVNFSTPQVPGIQLSRKVTILELMYSEAVKNTEVADYAMKTSMPFILPLDYPISPLKGNKMTLIKSIIVGSIYGFFIGLAFVVIRKIIRDILKSGRSKETIVSES